MDVIYKLVEISLMVIIGGPTYKNPREMITVTKVLNEIDRGAYIYRKEIWDDGVNPPTEMKSAYNREGHYIGPSSYGQFLKKIGIVVDIQRPRPDAEGTTCAVGFNPAEQKWYGWSHRAIFGFTIGSTCKKGDCHYVPRDKDDFVQDMIRFWSDPGHINVRTGREEVIDDMFGIHIEWEYDDTSPNEKIRGTIGGAFAVYPVSEDYGKGEWTATTLEEAKEMAIDFAKGVS